VNSLLETGSTTTNTGETGSPVSLLEVGRPSRRRRRCVRVSRLVVEVPNSKRAEQDCADEQDGGAGCQDVQFQGHAHAVVSQDIDDGESLTDKFSPPKRQRLCTAATRNCHNDHISGRNRLFSP
jgi:hypothetical protein